MIDSKMRTLSEKSKGGTARAQVKGTVVDNENGPAFDLLSNWEHQLNIGRCSGTCSEVELL
jgi:hypothetical protein